MKIKYSKHCTYCYLTCIT
uniref:Uncharacterized protein n=1 Tax=Anguilla anguilla TaxID=7936 RepID=A0A0E9SSD6_ANGAN